MRNERQRLLNHGLLFLLKFQVLFLPSFQGLTLFKAPALWEPAMQMMSGGHFLLSGERQDRPRSLPKYWSGSGRRCSHIPLFNAAKLFAGD